MIANGVDVDRFTPDGPASSRTDRPLITCVGRLTEAKGQAVLIRAFADLRDTDATLRLVGEGDAEQELRSLAVEAAVDDRIEWAGNSAAPELEYRAADVVVVPSRWDGLSLVLLEAMACGAAIVATTVTGVGGGAGGRGARPTRQPGRPRAGHPLPAGGRRPARGARALGARSRGDSGLPHRERRRRRWSSIDVFWHRIPGDDRRPRPRPPFCHTPLPADPDGWSTSSVRPNPRWTTALS